MARKAKTPEAAASTGERLAAIIARFKGRRILVVGDVILDRYAWGDVNRTSPEAPVPVVRLREETTKLGGAANVIANLAALGARARLVGVVGSDEAAVDLRGLLKEIGVPASGLVVRRGKPTTVKTRVVSLGQQLLRLDREEDGPLSEELSARILDRVERELARSELMILSDYGKGVLDSANCRKAIALARKAGVPIVVDPKGRDYARYRGVTVLKPNLKEAAEETGIAINSAESLARAARALQRTARAEAVVITRGRDGVSVFERRKAPAVIPAQARAVYDVTGAGDSFVAAMSLALAAGAGVVDAAQLGNAAGSIVVGRIGTATVEPGELARAVEPGDAGHKLRSPEQMKNEIQALRAAGKTVVFTNGFFDLFHLGHLKFLERARRLGGALIVAINSDASVRRLKGPPRPVLGETERAAILSSLDFVDYVVIFGEATPEALLRRLRPDVLVKGKAMRSEQVVGRKIVEAAGGRVEVLPMLGDTSTDAKLERIARQSRRKR